MRAMCSPLRKQMVSPIATPNPTARFVTQLILAIIIFHEFIQNNNDLTN
ncbi:hypothetical protein GXB80_06130 [Paenibacillus polymyxa]|nr:hypothetical protein [Paenibacillus polymyxa]